MELFIQIRDGKPFEHPIFGDNFRQAFPHIDTNNLPPEYARFERVPCPEEAGTYEVDDVKYEWVDDMVKDVWFVRPMTDEERAKKDADENAALLARVESYRNIAQSRIDSTTSEAAIVAWTDYLAELNAWVLVDWKTPNLPRMPRFDADGNLIPLTASGSAPNVIG